VPAPFTLIDGLKVPVRVAGHPGLELCNTLAGRNGRPEHDYLATYDHLVVWAGAAGLIAPPDVTRLGAAAQRHPDQATAAVVAARRLRARAYEVLLGRADADTFAGFDGDVQSAAASLRLTRTAPVRREFAAEAGLMTPVYAAAWAASEALVSAGPARIRACPGRGCGWLFLDRTGRRRWCTMATCGNRSKARRFAERHRKV
jgi:predicted RNA-binding Zn ribbon-like protein